MGLFNNNTEKEVSTGAVFGYVLLGFALVMIISFGIFVAIHKVSNTNKDEPVAIEETINTEEE